MTQPSLPEDAEVAEEPAAASGPDGGMGSGGCDDLAANENISPTARLAASSSTPAKEREGESVND